MANGAQSPSAGIEIILKRWVSAMLSRMAWYCCFRSNSASSSWILFWIAMNVALSIVDCVLPVSSADVAPDSDPSACVPGSSDSFSYVSVSSPSSTRSSSTSSSTPPTDRRKGTAVAETPRTAPCGYAARPGPCNAAPRARASPPVTRISPTVTP